MDCHLIYKTFYAIVFMFLQPHEGKYMLKRAIVLVAVLAWLTSNTFASTDRVVQAVVAEGSCAVVGMSAEQCQLTALQRARAAAIEKAAGVSVSSASVVTNFRLAADFIKAYAKGHIVKETVTWLPLGQYQKDPSTPPIPEYRVKIIADVHKPEKKIKSMGLEAKLNAVTFRHGEKVRLTIKTGRAGRLLIFNITADDKVVTLLPNQYLKNAIVEPGKPYIFPSDKSEIELEVQTLPGHKRDAEAYLVVVADDEAGKSVETVFSSSEPMEFSEFFKKYSEISDYCEDVILAYEVVGE